MSMPASLARPHRPRKPLPVAPKAHLSRMRKTLAAALVGADPSPDRALAILPPADLADPDEPAMPAQKRRHIHSKHRAFVDQFAAQDFIDPDRAARMVGYSRGGVGYKLAARLSDLIEAERVRIGLRKRMTLDEALTRVAELARGGEGSDEKVVLQALRTIIEVHGGLDRRAPRLPPGSADQQRVSLQQTLDRLARKGGKVIARETVREVETSIVGETPAIEAESEVEKP